MRPWRQKFIIDIFTHWNMSQTYICRSHFKVNEISYFTHMYSCVIPYLTLRIKCRYADISLKQQSCGRNSVSGLIEKKLYQQFAVLNSHSSNIDFVFWHTDRDTAETQIHTAASKKLSISLYKHVDRVANKLFKQLQFFVKFSNIQYMVFVIRFWKCWNFSVSET